MNTTTTNAAATGAPERHHSLEGLVGDCAHGSPEAWEELVETYSPVVWTVVRSFGFGPADAEDVFQMTWQRLVESLPTLRRPERLPAWLVTVTKREAIRFRARTRRDVAVAEPQDLPAARLPASPSPEAWVVDTTVDADVQNAVSELPDHHQALLGMLLVEPALSYDDISQVLDIPRGSIGPTRRRILARLREALENSRGPMYAAVAV